jgi:GxxExxY protein
MPISLLHPVPRISQAEFKELSYSVLGTVFEIHNEFGRFFDERIYKQELQVRLPDVELEFPIALSHLSYTTTYFVDAVIGGGAFEFKTVEALAPRHRGQLLNYLLMLDLGHGLLVNMRPDSVQHEFVNATLRPPDRHPFTIDVSRWDQELKGSAAVRQVIASLVDDWGAGLAIDVYEAALVHFLGGESAVLGEVPVGNGQQLLGHQTMRLAASGVAFRLTGFEQGMDRFEVHARKLLEHVDLDAIAWVNIAARKVTFTTIKRDGG